MSASIVDDSIEVSASIHHQAGLSICAIAPTQKVIHHLVPSPIRPDGKDGSTSSRTRARPASFISSAEHEPAAGVKEHIAQRIRPVVPAGKVVQRCCRVAMDKRYAYRQDHSDPQTAEQSFHDDPSRLKAENRRDGKLA